MAWINNDGLKVKFDAEKVEDANRRGESPGAGVLREITVQKKLSEIADGVTYVFDNVIIPRNSQIVQVDVLNVTVLAGGTSMAAGLSELDYTEYDYDGFVTGYDTLTAGLKTELVEGSTDHGALIGTKLTKPGIFTITPTGTFTGDSEVSITVHVMVPGADPFPKVYN